MVHYVKPLGSIKFKILACMVVNNFGNTTIFTSRIYKQFLEREQFTQGSLSASFYYTIYNQRSLILGELEVKILFHVLSATLILKILQLETIIIQLLDK